jgi:glycosyltransferase involved in cell wall biosynthesis
MSGTVHVVEPGGWGGIYQHAAAVAAARAEAGERVVFWSAADAEDVPVPAGVVRRACFWRCATVQPRRVRQAAVAARWFGVGVPAILREARRGDVVVLEGSSHPALQAPLVAGARCAVTFSPHNTFSRAGRPSEERLVRWLAQRADEVLALSEYDRRVIEGWGVKAVRRVPLAVGRWARDPDPVLVDAWRRRWGGGRVVLFAGQLRADKGLDVAVQAAAQWTGPRLAVVGEDLGALSPALREAARLGVDLVVDEGYQPLPRLVAAIAAADVVVCPYRVASVSGVMAMAAALGRPTVATDVGGLGESATVTVPPDDASGLAAGVDKALG